MKKWSSTKLNLNAYIYLNGHHIWHIQKLWMIYSWLYIIFQISILIMILKNLLIFNIDFDTDIDIDDQGRSWMRLLTYNRQPICCPCMQAQCHLLWVFWRISTHWGWVTQICVGNLTIIGSDNGFSPGQHQVINLNQCWNIVNWILRNKLQWNFNWNSEIFIQENVFETVVCEMVAILSEP